MEHMGWFFIGAAAGMWLSMILDRVQARHRRNGR